MVYGWAAASEDKRIDFSVGIARFGAILKERDRSSRSGPVRFLEIRRWVSGSSQRGRVCARLDPAGPGVGRGAGEKWPGRRWGPTRFPGCQRVAGPWYVVSLREYPLPILLTAARVERRPIS